MILSRKTTNIAALAMLGAAMVAVPDLAHATSADFGGVGGKLCEIVKALTGNVGKAIATFAIIFLGIGAFFGKVTWGLAVAVGIGVFAIFGAAKIVGQFGSNDGTCVVGT